jgi:hypothetical protein
LQDILVHPQAGGGGCFIEGEVQLTLSARKRLQDLIARLFADGIEPGGCPHADLKTAPVHRLDLPGPLVGTGNAGFTGKAGHARNGHTLEPLTHKKSARP